MIADEPGLKHFGDDRHQAREGYQDSNDGGQLIFQYGLQATGKYRHRNGKLPVHLDWSDKQQQPKQGWHYEHQPVAQAGRICCRDCGLLHKSWLLNISPAQITCRTV